MVTGGSSGIGLATAQRFVEEGAFVFITGRRQAELDKAVELIGEHAVGVQSDVADLKDIDALYARVAAEKGKIDVLIANAGMVEHRTIDDATPEHFDKTVDINMRGLFFTVQKALPLMREGGSIVLVSSILSSKAFPAHGVYSATKAAVRSFSRTWTLELKDRAIRVNTLSPGPIDTPIIDIQFPARSEAEQARKRFADAIPLGRMGRPEEIAAAALFLASDESSFVAGVELFVDGGMAQT